jgi:hypothetical protein
MLPLSSAAGIQEALTIAVIPAMRSERRGPDPRAAIRRPRDIGAAERVHTHEGISPADRMAEHHNLPGIASAATAVTLAHVAAGTSAIRIGAGGIMLPKLTPSGAAT